MLKAIRCICMYACTKSNIKEVKSSLQLFQHKVQRAGGTSTYFQQKAPYLQWHCMYKSDRAHPYNTRQNDCLRLLHFCYPPHKYSKQLNSNPLSLWSPFCSLTHTHYVQCGNEVVIMTVNHHRPGDELVVTVSAAEVFNSASEIMYLCPQLWWTRER